MNRKRAKKSYLGDSRIHPFGKIKKFDNCNPMADVYYLTFLILLIYIQLLGRRHSMLQSKEIMQYLPAYIKVWEPAAENKIQDQEPSARDHSHSSTFEECLTNQ